jgi:septation ring formation regulator EzrA
MMMKGEAQDLKLQKYVLSTHIKVKTSLTSLTTLNRKCNSSLPKIQRLKADLTGMTHIRITNRIKEYIDFIEKEVEVPIKIAL